MTTGRSVEEVSATLSATVNHMRRRVESAVDPPTICITLAANVGANPEVLNDALERFIIKSFVAGYVHMGTAYDDTNGYVLYVRMACGVDEPDQPTMDLAIARLTEHATANGFVCLCG